MSLRLDEAEIYLAALERILADTIPCTCGAVRFAWEAILKANPPPSPAQQTLQFPTQTKTNEGE